MPKLRELILDFFRSETKIESEVVAILKESYDREYISYSFILHFFFYFLLLLPPYFHLIPEVLPFLLGITVARLLLLIQRKRKDKYLKNLIFGIGIVADGLFYFSIGYALIKLPTIENFYLSNAYLMVSSILILLYSMRLNKLSCFIGAIYFSLFHLAFISFMPEALISETSFFARAFPILTFIGSGFIGSIFIINKRKNISSLYRLSEERRFMQQELELAKKVQDALFPKDLLIPGLRYKYYRENPNMIGGDFFDFVQLREGNVGVFLTDVAGHGISSALVASILKVLVSTINYRNKLSPSKLLDFLDERLVKDLNKYHASAIYLFFDFQELKLRIGNAGHPYLIHCPRGDSYYEIETDGAILGFNIRHPIAVEKTVSFGPGDRFFVYTDGLIESITSSGMELGTEGLLQILNKHREIRKIEELEAAILADIKSDFGIDAFLDDTMFLILEIE